MTKSKEIKSIVDDNKDKLPLYFNEAEYRFIVEKEISIYSKKYKDEDYQVFRFYKPIIRL